MKTLILHIKNHLIGFLTWILAITIISTVSATTDAWTIWALFTDIWCTKTGDYCLLWGNIKPLSIVWAQINGWAITDDKIANWINWAKIAPWTLTSIVIGTWVITNTNLVSWTALANLGGSIDAELIWLWTVNNTLFSYLTWATSNIQNQLKYKLSYLSTAIAQDNFIPKYFWAWFVNSLISDTGTSVKIWWALNVTWIISGNWSWITNLNAAELKWTLSSSLLLPWTNLRDIPQAWSNWSWILSAADFRSFNEKLSSGAISDWAKEKFKPTYAQSEISWLTATGSPTFYSVKTTWNLYASWTIYGNWAWITNLNAAMLSWTISTPLITSALSSWTWSASITNLWTITSWTIPWARLSGIPTAWPAISWILSAADYMSFSGKLSSGAISAWAKEPFRPVYKQSEIEWLTESDTPTFIAVNTTCIWKCD